MIAYPDIDPVVFELGPLKIYWYGLMYLGGILAAWWLTRGRMRSGRYPGWNDEQLADLTFYIALGVILGGRVGSIFGVRKMNTVLRPYERRRRPSSNRDFLRRYVIRGLRGRTETAGVGSRVV